MVLILHGDDQKRIISNHHATLLPEILMRNLCFAKEVSVVMEDQKETMEN